MSKKTKKGQNFANGSHLRDLYDRLACLVSEFLVYLIGGAQTLLFVYPSPTELALTTMYSPLSLSLSLSLCPDLRGMKQKGWKFLLLCSRLLRMFLAMTETMLSLECQPSSVR